MNRDVFQAIADPVRRDILEILSKESKSINGIAENFSISRQAVSKHIQMLHECGIIEFEKRGRERYCKLKVQNLIPAYLWLDHYRKIWEDRVDNFENYVIQLNKLRNGKSGK